MTGPIATPKFLYPLMSKKPKQKRKRIFHAVGVMKTEQEAQTPYHEGIYETFSPEEIKSHIPQYHVVPYSRGVGSNAVRQRSIHGDRRRAARRNALHTR